MRTNPKVLLMISLACGAIQCNRIDATLSDPKKGQSALGENNNKQQDISFPLSVDEYDSQYNGLTIDVAKETLRPFTASLNKLFSIYTPYAQKAGKVLSVMVILNKSHDGMKEIPVSRMDEQDFEINIAMGLLQLKDLTEDVFLIVMCHEIGHLLGGYPLHPRSTKSLVVAGEGQADYFATLQCTRTLWKDETSKNQTARALAEKNDPTIVKRCQEVWQGTAEQNICVRSILASVAQVTLMSKYPYKNDEKISFSTPDNTVVTQTTLFYPPKQCRLDTLVHGALCPVTFDLSSVPRNAEESRHSTCQQNDNPKGARPLCWYKPDDLAVQAN